MATSVIGRKDPGDPLSGPTARSLRPWSLPASDVASELGTDLRAGLSEAEAALRLERTGPNMLSERRRRPVWMLLVDQFANAMIVVLMVAAAVTAFIGDLKDTIVIVAIVVLNAIIGFIQEFRAERAMDALRRMTSPVARIVRDGEVALVTATGVVVGDVVRLEAGDIVTADLRLVRTAGLRIDEAALTGESEPVEKVVEPLPDVTDALLADQRNMAFSGTAATYGRGTGVVVATGMATALGRVAELMQEHGSGPTPLQRRLSALGRWLAVAALVVCSIVFVAGLARGESVEVMFLTAVSLAVAAIPEGLPAVVTIALALGARRLAQRHALIRKLPAVETLGSVTVICSDKTGTLTENRMLVEHVWTPAGEYDVTGEGYAPDGDVRPDPAADPFLHRLARVASACNDARLHAPRVAGGPWTMTGDPTEAALLALGGKLGIDQGRLEAERPRVEELTFDASRRRMATVHRTDDEVWIAVKGALEALAPRLAPADREILPRAESAASALAAQGYRVLALAERVTAEVPPLDEADSALRLLGLVGIADPPRSASSPAIEACRQAGVRPVMITGDHPLTAASIARRVGLLRDGDGVLTGAELAELDDDAFDERVESIAVYARTNPEQKLRIVDAWRRRDAVVAMTGDGVNDAPALKRADIGVAMGITGTEVSKEAADMVLADDDFATIVAAVEEGRRIYDNIRRFVRYLLTTNSAEIWVMFLAPFLGLPLPLIAIQILWINLVTDGLPALALGVEPVEPDAMRRRPRPFGESIMGAGLWQQAVRVGLLMAAVTLFVQAVAIGQGWPWQTMVFTTLALLQLGNALAVRSERIGFFRLSWRGNVPLLLTVAATAVLQISLVYLPIGAQIFETEPLEPVALAVVLAASTAAFVAVEVEKAVRARRAA
jgi:Ca2+-transporting ATPase